MSAVLLVCLSVGATLAFLTDTTNVVQNTFSVGNVSFLGNGLDEADVNEYGELLYKKTADGKTLTADPSEAVKDNAGNPILADRVTENEYKLIPGHTYVKDPTVHIDANSEAAYVFFAIDNDILKRYSYDLSQYVYFEEDADPTYTIISRQIANNGWEQLEDDYNGSTVALVDQNNWIVFCYRKPVVAGGTDHNGDTFTVTNGIIDLPIFEEFKIKTDLSDAEWEAAKNLKPIKIIAYAIQADGFDSAEAAFKATSYYKAPSNP